MRNNYRIIPATPDDLSWIAGKEEEVYGHNPVDVMPVELLQSWYRKNPSCFWMIMRGNSERIGNIYVVPLKPDVLARLIAGEIKERDIKAKDIYSQSESSEINSLHVVSLVCQGSSRAVLMCLRSFSQIVQTICNPRQVSHIYALSASVRGDSLIRHSGFQEIRSAAERSDGHPCYSIKYTDFINNPRLRPRQH
jgi:hypothetical protein